MGLVLAGRLELRREAGGDDRLGDEREVALAQLGLTAPVVVQACAELGVEAGDGLVAAVLASGGGHPQHRPTALVGVHVAGREDLGVVLLLVDHPQRDEPPVDVDPSQAGDLGGEPAGDPRPGADGIEEEVDTLGRGGHGGQGTGRIRPAPGASPPGAPDRYIIARDEARSAGSTAPDANGLEFTAATRSSALSTASVPPVAAR